MKHAPYAIIGDFNILFGKTTKTACERRVPTAKLASRDETDCPACIVQIAKDRGIMYEMIRAAKNLPTA